MDLKSCFDVVNSNCYSHILQKLHSKIRNKCWGQPTDLILPHVDANSRATQNSEPAECHAAVHALYALHVVWICHSIFMSLDQSPQRMCTHIMQQCAGNCFAVVFGAAHGITWKSGTLTWLSAGLLPKCLWYTFFFNCCSNINHEHPLIGFYLYAAYLCFIEQHFQQFSLCSITSWHEKGKMICKAHGREIV